MFTMRLKLASDRNKEWRCCGCLHVRTATIMFGIWHLVLHILALTVLVLVMRNHHINIKRQEFQQNDFLPTPLSKVKDDDNPYYLPTTQDGRPIYSSDIDMGALMTGFTLSITLVMVYGTIKGKATHLLPFFCLQLFDFAITTLTATGYFCYLRSAHRLIAEHWNLPLRHELLQLSPHVLTFLVLLSFLMSIIWKAYWICVVWRCYKYLTLRQQSARSTVHYIIPETGEGTSGRRGRHPSDPDYLFDQEAAFGGFPGAVKQTPPPSYRDVVGDMPPPYPAELVGVGPSVAAATMAAAAATSTATVERETPQAGRTDMAAAASIESIDAASSLTTSRVEANVEVIPGPSSEPINEQASTSDPAPLAETVPAPLAETAPAKVDAPEASPSVTTPAAQK